jgi:hypothetical protein
MYCLFSNTVNSFISLTVLLSEFECVSKVFGKREFTACVMNFMAMF